MIGFGQFLKDGHLFSQCNIMKLKNTPKTDAQCSNLKLVEVRTNTSDFVEDKVPKKQYLTIFMLKMSPE